MPSKRKKGEGLLEQALAALTAGLSDTGSLKQT